MISQCYDCKYANEYLLQYWYPYYSPSCLKGNPMYTKVTCKDFELIGRQSR